jgi:hypothetical protein
MGKEYQNLLEFTTIESIDGPIDGSCQGQAANQFGLVHGQEQRNVSLRGGPEDVNHPPSLPRADRQTGALSLRAGI